MRSDSKMDEHTYLYICIFHMYMHLMSPQGGRNGAPLCVVLVFDDFESLLYSSNTMQANDTRRKQFRPRILPPKWQLFAGLGALLGDLGALLGSLKSALGGLGASWRALRGARGDLGSQKSHLGMHLGGP